MYGSGSPFGGMDNIFDSAWPSPDENTPSKDADALVLDSAGDDLADKQIRANAMAAVLTWLDEPESSYDALESLIAGLADLDGDGDVTEPEEEMFNDLLESAGEAFLALGAIDTNVKAFIDDEDDESGKKLHKYLTGKLESTEKSDDDIITEYAVSRKQQILDATERVVRDGKLIRKKKRTKRYHMSSAQKAALKKARRKANNSAARRKRAKSMKVRKNRGLKK